MGTHQRLIPVDPKQKQRRLQHTQEEPFFCRSLAVRTVTDRVQTIAVDACERVVALNNPYATHDCVYLYYRIEDGAGQLTLA